MNLEASNGTTPLYMGLKLAKDQDYSIAETLVKHGANGHTPSFPALSPLFLALKQADPKLLDIASRAANMDPD